MHYNKPPLLPQQHIQLLKKRGLIIPDEERAAKYLKNVGYFRLTGYMFHLQSKDGCHNFPDETYFDDIIDYYRFDNKLRLLILSYMDRLEVGIRAYISDTYSTSHGFFWYTQDNLYADRQTYNYITEEILDRFKAPQEKFLKAYRSKYLSETYPPSNMAMEILSFGKLSKLYEGLNNGVEKQAIARLFDLQSSMLKSWLIHLTHVRNACAHHARIWNRHFTADRPIIPNRKDYAFNGELPANFNQTLYGIISIMTRLLYFINPGNSFIMKVSDLIDNYPKTDLTKMGFPENWKNDPAWKHWI